MLKIVLHINGEKKEFTQDFISGRMFRKAVDMSEKQTTYLLKAEKAVKKNEQISRADQNKLLDELYHFVSEVFGNKFSAEEYEDGTDARQIVDQSWGIVHQIVSQTMDPILSAGEVSGEKKESSTPAAS